MSVKMISGKPDCPLCNNGVIFNGIPGEERLCECATLIDLNIPEDTLSKWTPVGKLVNLPEHNPEQSQHTEHATLPVSEPANPDTHSRVCGEEQE